MTLWSAYFVYWHTARRRAQPRLGQQMVFCTTIAKIQGVLQKVFMTWFLPTANMSVRQSVRLAVTRVNCDKMKAPSEKSSIMTNRKSLTSFPISLRWTAYVAPNPPKGASKATIFSFFVQKIGLSSKKVCYKVSLCGNFQRQSCKAFIGLSICAQMVGGGCPLVSEILDQRDLPPSKMALSSLYSLVAPQA